MTTGGDALNVAADALVAKINAIDASIIFYPEPIEAHAQTPGLVTGEISMRNLVPVGAIGRAAHWDVDAVLLLATMANVPNWPTAIRRLRSYASPFGAKSILQKVYDDETLGGHVVSCRPLTGGLTGEQRLKFPDGDRWTVELTFRIRIGA